MRASMASLRPPPPISVVLSLSTTTRLARPSWRSSTCSRRRPSSLEITWPAVSTAMSCSISLRRSPKPGAFTATARSTPRIWLTTRVASASPSMSSAMNSSGRPLLAICSSSGTSSLSRPILWSQSSRKGSSSTACIFSASVMK
ncbi:hypothetical protein D3C78_969260 [compost metagenome]